MPDPEADSIARIAELADAARTQPTQQVLEALWGEIFRREHWYCVARGELPNVTPFIGRFPEGNFVALFTEEAEAHRFAVANELTNAAGAVGILSLPVEGAVQSLPTMAGQGATGVIFNFGSAGCFAPMANLLPMWNHLRGPATA